MVEIGIIDDTHSASLYTVCWHEAGQHFFIEYQDLDEALTDFTFELCQGNAAQISSKSQPYGTSTDKGGIEQ